ncbi:MAG: DUF6776 family protein [Burkholderiales bacterium]
MFRLRSLRKRFGITAPRVAVRTEVPWYLRWLGIAIVLAFAVALAIWMYDAGRRFAGFDRDQVEQQLSETKAELDSARSELKRLRAIANAAGSQLAIERTAQERLAQQIGTLEQQDGKLREDLAIFERMLTSDPRSAPALAIYRFEVTPDVLPGEFRYRMLLLTSGIRRDREFDGRLELLVSMTEDGKSAIMKFPERTDASASSFRLTFKYFRRVEGTFRVGPKSKVESVQVRVYEGNSDEARATQTVNLG